MSVHLDLKGKTYFSHIFMMPFHFSLCFTIFYKTYRPIRDISVEPQNRSMWQNHRAISTCLTIVKLVTRVESSLFIGIHIHPEGPWLSLDF